ncbi:MAG: autotransporter-associated beta strand repeat-containing protein, partial [Planctomycetota bacterium]|nr:autotransporter-associated beta strand repeat-containing protein [Planctomycetota bacterium]
MLVEPLEDRRLLASYDWNSAAYTVAVTLGTGESVTLAESAGTRTLKLSTGSWTATRDPATVSGTQLSFLPGNNIGTSISVDNTGALAGSNNVTWGGGTIASATITVNANASSTTSAINVSGGTTLQGNVALTANGAAITQAAVPLAVTGTLTLSAGAAQNITLNNAANDFSTVAITGGRNATLVDQNALTLGNVATSGSLAVTATAISLNGGSVTTVGNQTYTGPVTLGAATTLNSGGGNIQLTSSLSGAQNLTLAAGIGSGTVTATGAVTGLGTGVGAALTVADGVTGLVWFKGTWGGNSGLVATAGTNVRFDQDVTLADGDTATNLAGNVALEGLNWSSYDGIAFGPVTLAADTVSLNSDNGNVAMGPVTVTGSRALTLTAGSGNIQLSGAVGSSSNALGAITIVSAHEVTVSGALWASSLTVTATGSTSLQAVTVARDGLTLTGTDLALHDRVVTTSDGVVAITESGTVTIDAAADINSLGAVSITGSQISTAGDIVTNGDTVDLHGPVTLTGHVAINTQLGSGNGASITFWGTLDGAWALTLTTGTNSGSSPFNAVAFKQQVGAPAAEPVITIMSAYNVIFSAGIRAVSLTQVAGLGTTTLMGAVDTSAVNSNGNGVELVTGTVAVNESLTSHNNPISLQASLGLTVSATSGTVVDSGTGPIWLNADSDNNGSGTLILSNNVTVTSANPTAAAITLRAADVTIGSLAAVTASGSGSGGGVVVRSSAANRLMSLGGGPTVTGINLSDAELACLRTAADGTFTLGDSSQTGNITFTTATLATTAGAATVVVQSPSGGGKIVLDDGGTGPALNGNGGTVSLTAGTVGIQAATVTNAFAEIANATAVTLSSAAGIGTTTQALQLGATNLTSQSSASQFLSALAPVSITSVDAGTSTINLLGGTFNLTRNNGLAAASFLNVSGGATLALAGFQDTVAGVTLTSGNLTGSGGTLTSASDFQVQSGTVSAILAGAGGAIGLTKTTSGTVTLSGANTCTGSTSINAGTLAIDQGGSVNTSSGILLGDTSGTAAATLSLVDADGGTTVSAPLTVRSGSSGTKTIQAANTSGINTLASALTVNSPFTVSVPNAGGTLQVTGTAVALGANTLTVDAVGTVDVQRTITADAATNYRLVKSNSGKLLVGGSADNTNLSIQLNAGTLELAKTVANATNSLQIAGGTVKLTGGSDLQISNSGAVTFTGSGVLDLNGKNEAVDRLAGSVGQVTNSALGTTSTLTVGVSGGSSGFAGTLVDGAGVVALAKTGGGAFNLYPSVNNTYSGKTIVTGGILGVNKDTALGAVPAVPQPDNLTLDGGTLYNPSNSDNAGSFVNGPAQVNLDANRGVTLGSTGGTFRVWNGGFVTVNGVVSGLGLLSKTDRGTLGLMGNNTYSGKTSVTGGILSINSAAALGPSPGGFQADHLTLNGGTLANMTTASYFIGGNNISLGVNRGVTLGATGGGGFRTGYGFTITVDSVISGPGNLRKTDGVAPSGVLLLNAANTFTGDTDWFASGSGRGVIRLGNMLALQNSTVVMNTGTDGALDLNGLDNVVLGGLADNGANQGNVTIPANKTLKVGNNSNSTTYLGSLSGVGSTVEKIGSGTWSLEGNNASTVAWKISSGTLYATAPGALGTGPVTANGGVLQVGTAETLVSGFASGWTLTGNASQVSPNVIQLTPDVTWQGGSAFFARPVSTTGDFTASFTLDTPSQGPSPADGVSFVLQNDNRGLAAMGTQGNCLGYSADVSTGAGGILPSAALMIDIFAGDANGQGLRVATNGSGGGSSVTNVNVSPVDLTNPVTVSLSYNASAKTLTVSLAEGANSFGPYTFTAFDLPSILGQTAYVGFTGATGGSHAQQQISNFNLTSAATPATTYANALTVATGVTGNVSVVGTSVNPTITLGALTMGANATLNLAAAGSSPSDSNYGLTVGATTLSVAPTFTVANHGTGTGTLTLGALADGGTARTVSKQGPGVLALAAGATSLVNGTQVNVANGTLRSDHATALGTLAKVDVAGGTTFRVGASQTVGALTGTGSTTLNGQTLTVGSTNNLSGAFDGVLSDDTGAGGVTKAGLGTWTLTGSNTFSGPLSVAAGTLALPTVNNDGLPGPLGQSALPVTLGSSGLGGKLEYTGASATSTKKFQLAAGGSGIFQIDTLETSLAVSGLVSGSGDLIKTGAGTLGLGGANTYGG